MKTILLTRTYEDDYQTTGKIEIYDPFEGLIFTCKTLELPWRGNQKDISRIPDNSYLATKHISPKFGECILVNDVEGRTWILIHKGNFHRDILGCILVGESFYDIDGDGHLDVTNSSKTMKQLMKILDDENHLNIIEEWNHN